MAEALKSVRAAESFGQQAMMANYAGRQQASYATAATIK